MIKALKISAIIITVALATGCASTSAVEDLQSQLDGLNTKLSAASSDAANAQAAASSASQASTEAAAKASAAEAAANRAAQYAQETNSKLDRMFKKSMMK